jgi:iron complex transport system substrate-binding protein
MKNVIYISFILLLLAGCTNEISQNTNGEVIKNKYAKGFEISEIDEGYILKVSDRFNNESENTQNYLLSSKSDYESGNNEIINIPVSRVVCLSTTHCAFISQLDKISTIKGISGLDYVYNDQLRDLIRRDEISETGYDNQVNLEKIISLNPDVVFAYGIDNNSISMFQKLSEIGIPVVYVGDFVENSPIGRTEWIKFFACFYDNFDYSCEFFDSVDNRYQTIKKTINDKKLTSPEILFNLPWKGTWWVPGNDSYLANFIKDAGGSYLMAQKNNSESVPLTVEEVFANSQNADIWLNPNQIKRKNEILEIESRLSEFKPYKECRIYNNNKRINKYGGNDFYESGIIHPDIILYDLGIIFHKIDSIDNLHYYQEIK